jgi:hypothetical protein
MSALSEQNNSPLPQITPEMFNRVQKLERTIDEIKNIKHSPRPKQGENSKQLHQKITEVRQEIQELQPFQKRGIELQKKFFAAMEQNPSLTWQELKQMYAEDDLSPLESKILHAVFSQTEGKVKRTQRIYDRFMRQAQKKFDALPDSEKINTGVDNLAGKLFFRAIMGKEAEGEIYEVELRPHPFALQLILKDTRDRQALDDAGSAHFNREERFLLNFANFPSLAPQYFPLHAWRSFPFIYNSDILQYGPDALGKPTYFPNKSLLHEEGHNENDSILKGLEAREFQMSDQVFGEKDLSPAGFSEIHLSGLKRIIAESVKRSKEKGQPLDIAEVTDRVRKKIDIIWNTCLTSSKDEVIADFKATGTYNFLSVLHLDSLQYPIIRNETNKDYQKSLWSYQYLGKAGLPHALFKLAKETPELKQVYENIANEYNSELDRNVKTMESIWKLFQEFPDTPVSREDFLAFMRQNPITTWQERAPQAFAKEISIARQSEKKYSELDQEFSQLTQTQRETTEAFSLLYSPIWKMALSLPSSAENQDFFKEYEELALDMNTFTQTYDQLSQLLGKKKWQGLTDEEYDIWKQGMKYLQEQNNLTIRIKNILSEAKKVVTDAEQSHPITQYLNKQSELKKMFRTNEEAFTNTVYQVIRKLLEKLCSDQMGGKSNNEYNYRQLTSMIVAGVSSTLPLTQYISGARFSVVSLEDPFLEEKLRSLLITYADQFEAFRPLVDEVHSTLKSLVDKHQDLADEIQSLPIPLSPATQGNYSSGTPQIDRLRSKSQQLTPDQQAQMTKIDQDKEVLAQSFLHLDKQVQDILFQTA